MLRIALAQINVTVGDLGGNADKIISFINQAKEAQADAVFFPEMAICGYPAEDLLLKEHFVKDCRSALEQVARRVEGVVAVVGCLDRDAAGSLYNAAAVIASGRVAGVYHKQCLPNYGVFDEKRYFQAGGENTLFSLKGHCLGINICEDIWEKDGPPMRQVKGGATVLVNLSSSPYDYGKLEQRQAVLQEAARRHRVPVCYVNLVGGQDELVFDGGSLVIHPNGEIVHTAPLFEEALLLADLPSPGTSLGSQENISGVVALPSRQVNEEPAALTPAVTKTLSPDERILEALTLGTRDYVRKNGFEKVVIGLSGGIDSALVAAIAVRAIGKENVVGISMPSRYSSRDTQTDAKAVAGNLGIRFLEVPIQDIVQSFLAALSQGFAGTKSGVAEENLQARIRGNILMAFSNKFNWLVLTTGNKSEIAVGYCTLYGDMSGGFGVIKDLPKTKVYEMAALINRLDPAAPIPQTILERPPTAELRENQKDEDSLPPYAVLDPLLEGYVEQHRSLQDLAHLLSDTKTLAEVIKKVDLSEYKRRQAAPGIKITPRAFGKDWRLPITNKYKGF